ncbi:uncharacterized protein LOC120358417 [Solenopsis invicta]|uniref:uncharacterized protein LOC120358417 n=1 Tax=Solenopsis invicta TaxID=13686 RepID=UPI00193DB82F|nr:uncharacterized protein LOC120358417 [Solenopsis invicta]
MFDDHCKFNETLLRFFGLWPYERTVCERLRAICFNMLFISHVIAEFAQFAIVDFFNVNITIRILRDAITTFLIFVIFNMFFLNTKKLKRILDEIINNRRMITDSQEIEILDYYAYKGKKIIVTILSLVMCITFMTFVSGLLPDIFDVLWPLNESRVHDLLVMKEYKINEGIQYYIFCYYSIICINIGGIVTTFIISTLLSINLHCCAIYKVCSYRIKQFVDKEVIACSSKGNVNERIIKTVELHRKAKKLFKLITTSFTMSYLIMAVAGMCGFAMSLYGLLNVIIYKYDLTELLTTACFIIGYEFCLFTITIMGQLLINHSDELFKSLYMSLWYEAPITVQKSILFIMQISVKSLVMNLGGVLEVAMQTFTSITNMSISFMMIFFSIQ